MSSKSIISFIAIFAIQFFMSCDPCGCDDVGTYEIEYNGITVTPWNTAGFVRAEVTDTVYRNAFGLTLSVNSDSRKISQIENNFGFSAAFALSCVDNEYIYADPIDYAEIYITNVSTDDQYNATQHFEVYEYANERISLAEFFLNRDERDDNFQFELAEFDTIPTSVIFTVNVYLKSGIMFSEKTQQIDFHD